MRILASFAVGALVLGLLSAAPAAAQTQPLPLRKGTKYKVKIDSSPQQAAVYIDNKQYGIQGYTPITIKLPKGPYKVIVELPGWKPMEREITVKRAEAFVFTLERQPRPAVIDVRSTAGDSASGGQLLVDGAPAGTVPGRAEVPAGRHVIEVKKQGWKDFRDTVDVQEGETRTLVVNLEAELKKGALLVTADVAGAEVWVDGTRRDQAPTMITDLPEGDHTVEVRKDPLPAFRQVVRVIGNQQVKVEARFSDKMAGSLRIVSSTPEAEVLVDGESKGRPNTEITGVRPGQHIVELRAKGYQPQSIEVQVTAGEQRVAKLDLQPTTPQDRSSQENGRLRVVTAVPDAEVFLDGASVGKAPVDRKDLAPGKHFVVVRKQGFADWQREIDMQAGQTVSLTAELAATAQLKVLANVAGADVYLDGSPVGKTPLTLPTVPAGDHLIEVKKSGYLDAKQSLRVEGGEQKILSADLVEIKTGPTASDLQKRARGASSFSAVTLDPARFTFDIAGGFLPFAQVRLTVGALRKGMFGLDAGVGLQTTGYMTVGGAHAKFQFLRAGPFAMGTQIFIGGGGGPGGRNNFTFEWGIPLSLLFGDIVRVTANPYVQVATDRLCPDAMKSGEADICSRGFGAQPTDGTHVDSRGYSGGKEGQNVRDRFLSARLMLQFAIEVAVHQVATVFLIVEGAPTGQRAAYTGTSGFGYNDGFKWKDDPQVYGRLGVTFKF
jgi:hypothetical protein